MVHASRYFLFVFMTLYTLSKLAQAVMLLHCIWEHPVSNIDQDSILSFPVIPANARMVPLIRPYQINGLLILSFETTLLSATTVT
jgi:hypothetical protein